MTKAARIGFITASVVLIFTGVVHNLTQFFSMSTPEIKAHMDAFGPMDLMGTKAMLWDLWLGLSYLMGFFAMAFGASNLAGLYALGKGAHPSRGVAVVGILMQAVVCLSGILYLSSFQAVGGPIGMIMFGLTLLPARNKSV